MELPCWPFHGKDRERGGRKRITKERERKGYNGGKEREAKKEEEKERERKREDEREREMAI
jgi:hypothetical protein